MIKDGIKMNYETTTVVTNDSLKLRIYKCQRGRDRERASERKRQRERERARDREREHRHRQT